MPDIDCDINSPQFQKLAVLAVGTLGLYCVYLPGKELMTLWAAWQADVNGSHNPYQLKLSDPDFLQGHSWFVCKYHARCWYAEFAFLYYRMAIVACSVIFASPTQTDECMLSMALASAVMLVFVVRVKPFDDGLTEVPDALCGADKMQAYSLAGLMVALLVAVICKQTPDRDRSFDLIVDIVVAMIATIPALVGLWEVFQTSQARKNARQEGLTIALEGEGKLGLVFIKGTAPLTIKSISPDGLAAAVSYAWSCASLRRSLLSSVSLAHLT